MTSKEKRELIQQGAQEGMSVAEMSRVYRVPRRTVYDLLERERTTGAMQSYSKRSGRRPALDELGLDRMRQLILENPDITLEEIKESMRLNICLSAIHRIIYNKLGFTYKKRQYTPVNETDRMF